MSRHVKKKMEERHLVFIYTPFEKSGETCSGKHNNFLETFVGIPLSKFHFPVFIPLGCGCESPVDS